MKKLNQYKFLIPFIAISLLTSCSEDDSGPDLDHDNPYQTDDTSGTYSNPVFTPVLADPSVVKYGSFFYAYGTEDDWGSDGGYHCVPIVRSTDMVNWEFVQDAFSVKPNWKDGGIWAPDVSLVNGQYYMYYSFSTWGDPNAAIGLAIAPTPEGPFADQGKLFDSDEIGVANSIDAFYIEDEGTKYLFWGSFHGIYATQLNDDGTEAMGDLTHIAGNDYEASYIYQKDGFYYYFASKGSCCDGINSTYHVVVARSENLLGPYVDANGNDLRDGNYGTLVLGANSGAVGYVGPGHNAEIIVDSEGDEWISYHGIPKNNPNLDNGASRRPLLMDKIIWVNGWPQIENQEPSLGEKTAPLFN